jgi:transcriptional regulator with XRE-family HTH domain
MSTGFGAALREWRHRRRYSQLQLSAEAGVSQRHVSFLETGRARPSPEMVVHLATVLEVPLRERNSLLVAAGYAPLYPETGLDEPALAQVRHVLEFLLEAHEPFPAIVVDRRWDVVKANGAATRLMMLGDATSAGRAVNLARLSLHPDGIRRFTVNWTAVATSVMDRLRREAAVHPNDPVLQDLVREVEGYDGVADLPRRLAPTGDDLLVPVHYRWEGVDIRLFGTIATLGAPYDVTLEELRLETLFPADEASERVLQALGGD